MLEADAMHAAIRAAQPGEPAPACEPGHGEWCGGMRLAVDQKLVGVGTANTSGANFSPVMMLKNKLRLSYCAWCGADLDLERRLAKAIDDLAKAIDDVQLYDAAQSVAQEVRTSPKHERILPILDGPKPASCHVLVRGDSFLALERALKGGS